MQYQVSRNGQMYGPYTLEDLQRYVASGHVLYTDLAKSEDMAEWLPVSQILGTVPVGAAPTYTAPTSYAQPAAGTYPDAPNLNWGLELLLGFLTCGLFVVAWNLVIASWAKRVEPTSKALLYYIIATVLIVLNFGGSYGNVIAAMHRQHPHQSILGGLIGIATWVIRLIARFTLRDTLEKHYNGAEPLGLRLSAVMTFFFGGIYFQYKLNRINEIKETLRYRKRHTMTVSVRSRIAALLRAAAPLAVAALAAAVLLRFPPGQYTFYPQCPIYRYLHLQCPGCGATRALAALLHGHIAEALRLNPLTTLLMPFAVIYAAAGYRRFLRREPIRLPRLPCSAVYASLAVAILFAVVRNLGHI